MDESIFFKAAETTHQLEQKKIEALKNLKSISENLGMTEFGDLLPSKDVSDSKQMKLFYNGKDRIVTVFDDGKIYDPNQGIDGEWIDDTYTSQLKELSN